MRFKFGIPESKIILKANRRGGGFSFYFAFFIKVIKKMIKLMVIIEGPTGRSNINEQIHPPAELSIPKIEALVTIPSGVLER